MNQNEILQIFKDAGALLEGHFLLSSGLHSQQYLQCARVLENPQVAQKLCQELAKQYQQQAINVVIGPALGGITLAYELARALGVRALFAERVERKMCLRRGFKISEQDKVLVAEDVITTGGSVKEVIALVKEQGAKVAAACALADRSQGGVDFGVEYASLLKLAIKNFSAQQCPLCQQGLPLVKPGSKII